MDETQIAVSLKAYEHEIETLQYRVRSLEDQSKSMHQLVISVNRMAVSIENMQKEMNLQGERLKVLEMVPGETGRLVKAAIITSVTGAVIGAAVTAVLAFL